MAYPAGAAGDESVIPRSERESNSASNGAVGLSELQRDSRALCWPEANGLEYEGAPSDGGFLPGAGL